MKLSPEAIIAKPKLTGYLLKLLPQDDKSQYLQQAGFTLENWQDLEKALREQILSLDATPTESDRYGDKYMICDQITGINGQSLNLVTIWMIEHETKITKFITLFPNKS